VLFDFLKANYANLFYIVNDVVLFSSLFILIKYADDTKRIAKSTQEANLRPVILRSDYLPNWNALKSIGYSMETRAPLRLLEFSILKNIAIDITGYLILDHIKYELLFAHLIPEATEDLGSFQPKWGWMQSGNELSAIFTEDSGQSSNQSNMIVIDYQDIAGNKYRLTQKVNFTQTTTSID